MARPPVVHHADITEGGAAEADIVFRRRRLGRAAGSVRIGASHYRVPPYARQMPVHVHGDEEEIFYVLAGGGLGYELPGQDPGGPADAYAVTTGDVVVQCPDRASHTFLAGARGLELIAFGSGSETSLTFLPRAGVMWCGPRWVPLDAPHPFTAEGLAGPLTPPSVDPTAPRPGHVVALADVVDEPLAGGATRRLGAAAGAVAAGLNQVTLAPGEPATLPHCHSLSEELFVVLDETGTLRLGADAHPLIAGDVVGRPPATRVPHLITAGPDGLTYLAYGTREPGDAVAYPEAGKVWIRGLDMWLDSAAPPASPSGAA
jgi:uncharacterized cupin superfamily protein